MQEIYIETNLERQPGSRNICKVMRRLGSAYEAHTDELGMKLLYSLAVWMNVKQWSRPQKIDALPDHDRELCHRR